MSAAASPLRTPGPRVTGLRALTAPFAFALVLSLTGCGQLQASEAGEAPAAEQASENSTTSEPSQASTADLPGKFGGMLAAGHTALSMVPNSEVVRVEATQEGWTVRLAVMDGTEHEVRINADGSRMKGLPLTHQTPDERRQQNRVRLHVGQLDHDAAVHLLHEAVAPTEIVDLRLDSHQDRVVWAATLEDQRAFRVDALNSEVTAD